MDTSSETIKHHKYSWRKYLNSGVLFVVIGVLTVFNLGANLFNSYMAFTSKADQKKLREAQSQISSNLDRLEKQQQAIDKLQIDQDEDEVRADDSDKRSDASDKRNDKIEMNANK